MNIGMVRLRFVFYFYQRCAILGLLQCFSDNQGDRLYIKMDLVIQKWLKFLTRIYGNLGHWVMAISGHIRRVKVAHHRQNTRSALRSFAVNFNDTAFGNGAGYHNPVSHVFKMIVSCVLRAAGNFCTALNAVYGLTDGFVQ